MNQIIIGDCLSKMLDIPNDSVDCVITDPPYNIGLDYKSSFNDNQDPEDYINSFLRPRLFLARRKLKPNGSFFLIIGQHYQAETLIILKKMHLFWRNTLIWHYTFGPNQRKKFTPSWVAIHYLVNDPTNFTFHPTKVPSDRQLIYNDKRANPEGKVPNDLIEFPIDTLKINRVCGTFGERIPESVCQLPQELIKTLIETSTEENQVVFDPFCGVGTIPLTAKQMNRKFIGIELDQSIAQTAISILEK